MLMLFHFIKILKEMNFFHISFIHITKPLYIPLRNSVRQFMRFSMPVCSALSAIFLFKCKCQNYISSKINQLPIATSVREKWFPIRSMIYYRMLNVLSWHWMSSGLVIDAYLSFFFHILPLHKYVEYDCICL